MKVLFVPLRLKLAVYALFLCIPLIAIEIIIANRSPWWQLPVKNISYWILIFSLICVPLTVWLSGAKKWAFVMTVVFSFVWIWMSAWVALRMKYPPLGFFTLLLLAFCIAELSWLKYELERSFFDPQLSWFQSLPKPIPALRCQLSGGEKLVDLRVSRMDKEGAFVFSQVEGGQSSPILLSLLERRRLQMIFSFRDRQIICEGIPTISVGKGIGAGIQFLGISADLRKEIGDFIEVLRGEGYV